MPIFFFGKVRSLKAKTKVARREIDIEQPEECAQEVGWKEFALTFI